MSMIDRGNGGQHFCLFSTLNRILSERPRREDMGHINLEANFEFSGFVLRGYTNSCGRVATRENILLWPCTGYRYQNCSTTWIIFRVITQVGQRTEGTETTPNTMLQQNWRQKTRKENTPLGGGGGKPSIGAFLSGRICNHAPDKTEGRGQ
jgi:hypothetical protein